MSMRDWQVAVEYPLAKVDLPLREGWQRSSQGDGGMSFVQAKPTLSTALENALIIKSPLSNDDSDEITVRIWLSFPEEDEAGPRQLLLRCHGVGVEIGMIRNGAVVAKGVRVSELTAPRTLRKKLLPGLRVASEKKHNLCTIVPHARHCLKVVVRRHGRRLRATVHLDEDPRLLIPHFEVSGSHAIPELALIAMHPLTVHAVRFEGEVRHGN